MNQIIGHAVESDKHNVRCISLYNRLKLSFICHGKTDTDIWRGKNLEVFCLRECFEAGLIDQ